MTLDQLVSALNARKNTGAWSRLAVISGVSYDTIVRIARGEIANPGILTVERIAEAFSGLPEQV